jgi:type I restriction enzyme M protein
MILHGIKNPNLSRINGLSKQFDHNSKYHVILANPPFAGTIDKDSLNPKINMGGKKTELLFLKLFYNLLEPGGRAAVIVPVGVLFGSTNAHLDIKKLLLKKCSLDAIIYLPSGVFQPYSDIKTAIIFFRKSGSTEKVWLYAMENDGKSLDVQRETIKENDIPDILKQFPKRGKTKFLHNGQLKSLSITINEIETANYNLNYNHYIDDSIPEVQINIQDVVNKINELKIERKLFEEQMVEDLNELDFKV